MNTNSISLRGTIDKVIYYDENKSWGVFLFYTEDNVESDAFEGNPFSKRKYGTITGSSQRLTEGTKYLMELEEKYNAKYGKLQFQAIKIYEEIPTTESEKRNFLEFIITKQQTDTLLEHYPNVIQDIIDGKEIDISVLKNMNESRFEKIKQKIEENYIISDLLIFLSPYGVTYAQAKKISTLAPSTALVKDMVMDNPYILTSVSGFGFLKVDQIALKLRPDLQMSKERVRAFLEYILEKEADSDGHTWITRQYLIELARKNIPECVDFVKVVIDEERDSPDFLHQEGDKVGRRSDYEVELSIKRELDRINNARPCFKLPKEEDINEYLKEIEDAQGFELSKEQRKTMSLLAKDGNVIIVSGSAGSGKSTSVNSISTILDMAQGNGERLEISQIALSAKASIRLKQVTGRESTTIHKFLYDIYMESTGSNSEEVDLDDYNMDRFESLRRIRGSDIIIIDEFSMVNIYLTLQVLKEVKSGAMIIFVFDYAQLPAIGAGSVAYDLLELSNYKKSKYVEVHRQGMDSGILMDANIIKEQKSPVKEFSKSITHGNLNDMTYMFRQTAEEINADTIKYFISGVKKFGIDNINIITPRKNKVLNSAEELNKAIQAILIPKGTVAEFINPITKKTYRLGDKVIHKKNMSGYNIFNGEIGTIIKVDDSNDNKKPVRVLFDYGDDRKVIDYDREMLKYLELAYALTVHSYQGSENNAIIVAMDSSSFILLDNTMLYTAMTRAKDRCVLVTDPSSFNKCIKEHKTLIRNTWLKTILN